MTLRFTVLASGSGGNASLVEAAGFGVLLDIGLGPRQLASRLAGVGREWSAVHAVLLTHTHSDHWRDTTLVQLRRRHIPLYCHADHHRVLRLYASAFDDLLAAGLVHTYVAGQAFDLAPGLRCRPLPVRHDGGATFGFRLEGGQDLFGEATALGYVADLGCWDDALADALAGVDLLALEFNHDVALESASGRSPLLIARVLGDHGHLSNDQAADLLRAVLDRSPVGRLRHLVQLHLSRECNIPSLAQAAAHAALAERAPAVVVHTARQDAVTTTLPLGEAPGPSRLHLSPGRRRPGARPVAQQWLPGLEESDPTNGNGRR
jgi:phosphoribosyl 1,2-cyclic phosphodiesterase